MEAKVDVRKLQLLNDRINQLIDAMNQVRVSVHSVSPTAQLPQVGVPFGAQAAGLGLGVPTADHYRLMLDQLSRQVSELARAIELSRQPQVAGMAPQAFQLGGLHPLVSPFTQVPWAQPGIGQLGTMGMWPQVGQQLPFGTLGGQYPQVGQQLPFGTLGQYPQVGQDPYRTAIEQLSRHVADIARAIDFSRYGYGFAPQQFAQFPYGIQAGITQQPLTQIPWAAQAPWAQQQFQPTGLGTTDVIEATRLAQIFPHAFSPSAPLA
ncbi:MAG: hypothetical protein HY698_08865 [Deltaproteobacteria bacterium]|nr:hypothetical protein [Deltaproteobacteria bacterium]